MVLLIKEEFGVLKNIWFYLILHLVFLGYSLLGYISKSASNSSFLSIGYIISLGILIAGMGIYAILWQQFLKRKSLIILYANKAVSVVWGVVWGFVFFDEPVTLCKIIGAIVIIVGIIFVVSSESESEA